MSKYSQYGIFADAHRTIFSILKRMRYTEKLLYHFKESTPHGGANASDPSNGYYTFSFETKDEIFMSLLVQCHNTNENSGLAHYDSKSKRFSFSVNIKSSKEEIYEMIKKGIFDMQDYGADNEAEFSKQLLFGISQASTIIIGVENPTKIEDTKFKVDKWILLKNKSKTLKMPLQIKSSREGQEKHRAKNPEIPSIIFCSTKACSAHLLAQTINTMGLAWIAGNIRHESMLRAK